MKKHKILEVYLKTAETQKIIKEKYNGSFTLYLEDILDEYSNAGWDIISPNIVYNGFGGIFKAIFVFQKEE